MANFSENFGLEALMEEDTAMGFVSFLAQEGKAVMGYYGFPYLYKPLGAVEYWLKTERRSSGELEISAVDSHCGGKCIWDMVCSGIDVTPKSFPKLGRVHMMSRADGSGGLLPVELITADVLPSYLKGDPVKMQVIGLPLEINYYADDDEYEASQPADSNGHKWLVASGNLFPATFLINHNPDTYEQDKDYHSDAFVHFTATVTKLLGGTFDLSGNVSQTFIRCFVDTEYGPLELEHTLEQVSEEQRQNIKVGSVVSGLCVISGDAAIYEYENGAIKDFDHDLALLRYTFMKGDPERLRSVLTAESVYDSDNSDNKYVGADSIIDRIRYVQENSKVEYFAHPATITASAGGLEYPEGTRCIVLASGDEENYESVVFIDVDENGLIDRIRVSTDGGYHFKTDDPAPVKSPLDEIEVPGSVMEPILLRAKFHGIIEEDCSPDTLAGEIKDYHFFERNAHQMLDELKEHHQPDVVEALRGVFGYLFAKAIEQEYNERHIDGKSWGIAASYCPVEAFHGELTSTLDEEKHAQLEKAFELGKEFFNDFSFYMQVSDAGEEHFTETAVLALVIVQWLGQQYTDKCFAVKEDA